MVDRAMPNMRVCPDRRKNIAEATCGNNEEGQMIHLRKSWNQIS
jgi:hypothetical protein